MLKTVFMGTPTLVMPALKSIYENSKLELIITGKDKPAGRGMKNTITPKPKEFAIEKNIPFLQIDSAKDPVILKMLNEINPDVTIVFAFGFFIPENVYSYPKFGSVNIHTSLLPKYRGASPIQSALLNNETITGITFQKINNVLDCGDILFTKSVEILPNDDYLSLEIRLSDLSGILIKDFLEKLENGVLSPLKQNNDEATFCKKINKTDGEIIWDMDADNIVAKIKAFSYWPVCYAKSRFGNIRIFKAEVKPVNGHEKVGTVINADKNGLWISCKKNAVSLLEIQPENKKRMDFISFLNGHRIKTGEIL